MLNAQSIREKLASTFKEFKAEEKPYTNPYSCDKAVVLLETKAFHDPQLQPKKICQTMTKVLYLITQGEKLTPKEATDLFFGVTKLFQSPNERLRRMVYLLIKNIQVSETEQFIVTSCLTKDMNSKNDCYRANSLRVLSRILDPSMASQIERYIKTAVVDKSSFVASSALVCGINLMRTAPDVVRRWLNEVTDSVSSKHQMVQFQALALLYELKKNDRLALHKVVMSLTKSFGKSAMAECLLIRYAARVLSCERDKALEKALMDYLESCLRHKSEMAMFEAAKAYCELALIDEQGAGGSMVFGYDMLPAITVLQIFLTSPKPVVRFAAIHMLNRLAQQRPHVVSRCNVDMEPLLTDQNRSIATLALTTLLKTGHESNVDRLIKQITSFMAEISDTYKSEVVRAVKTLALQYPSKYKVLLQFLSLNLREEGSVEFKKEIVDALIMLSLTIPNAKEVGLLHLCEFIEDCEYPTLCTKILAFMGDHVSTTAAPSKFIRFIYNRLILENAPVRAAGVDALTKIGMACPALRKDIVILLESCTADNDDEVRDRAGLYSKALEEAEAKESARSKELVVPVVVHELAVDALCDMLEKHINHDASAPFDLSKVPTEEKYQQQRKLAAAAVPKKEEAKSASGIPAPKKSESMVVSPQLQNKGEDVGLRVTAKVQHIVPPQALGALLLSSKAQQLTENEAEYTVSATKHMFQDFVVCELAVTNTLQNQTLENAELRLSNYDQSSWRVVGSVPIPTLPYGDPLSAYLVLQKLQNPNGVGVLTGNFSATLTYTIKEEGDDLGYQDEYPVEQLTIVPGNYLVPKGLRPGEFKSVWEAMQSQGVELSGNYSLAGLKTVESAVQGIITKLNMAACDDTAKIEAGAQKHTLLLAGHFMGGVQVVVKALVGIHQVHGCLLKIAVRTRNQNIGQVVLSCIE